MMKLVKKIALRLILLVGWILLTIPATAFLQTLKVQGTQAVSIQQLGDNTSTYTNVIQNTAFWQSVEGWAGLLFLVPALLLLADILMIGFKFYVAQTSKEEEKK